MEASSNPSSSPGTSDSAATKAQPRSRNLWTKSEDEVLMRGAAMLRKVSHQFKLEVH